MLFLTLFEVVLCVVIAAGLLTQFVIPLVQGKILFPVFRKEAKELEDKKALIKQEISEKKLEKAIAELELDKQKLKEELEKLQKEKEAKDASLQQK